MPDRKQVEAMLAKVSDNYLKECYGAVQNAYKHDAALTDDQKRQFEQFQQDGVYYGTDIYSDWAEWKEMLNSEIERRNLDV